jgi:hypothetical protein
VFTPEQVKEQAYPNTDYFYRVADLMKSRIALLPGLIGGIFCGSAAYRQYTVRSDLNVVLLCEPEFLTSIIEDLRKIRRETERNHIPFDFRLVDQRLASTPMSCIDGALRRHLSYCVSQNPDCIIKENPLSLIKLYPGESKTTEMRTYLRMKTDMLMQGIYHFNPEDPRTYDFLGNMLDVAIHVARRTLWATGENLDDDTRSSVVAQYRRKTGRILLPLFDNLLAADAHYTEHLHAQIKTFNKSSYIETIRDLRTTAEDALRFVLGTADTHFVG